MQASKSGKLPSKIKIVIILAVLVVIFVGILIAFTISSTAQAVNRAVSAAEGIGTVTYSQESKDRIDLAAQYVNEIETNESWIRAAFLKSADSEELQETILEAEKEYVRLAIKNATVTDQRKYADHYTDADVDAAIEAAREAVDEYFEDNYQAVETYADLTALEDKYSGNGSSDANDAASSEQPEATEQPETNEQPKESEQPEIDEEDLC